MVFVLEIIYKLTVINVVKIKNKLLKIKTIL